MNLVVINDFNIMRPVIFPDEADTPFVVDANAVLPLTVSS